MKKINKVKLISKYNTKKVFIKDKKCPICNTDYLNTDKEYCDKCIDHCEDYEPCNKEGDCKYDKQSITLPDGIVYIGDNIFGINTKDIPYIYETVVNKDWLFNCSRVMKFKTIEYAEKILKDLVSTDKQSIEEAALKYVGGEINNEFNRASYIAFIAGAKYKEAKMYSEEEVLDLLNCAIDNIYTNDNETGTLFINCQLYDDAKSLLEELKNRMVRTK